MQHTKQQEKNKTKKKQNMDNEKYPFSPTILSSLLVDHLLKFTIFVRF